MLSRIAIYAVVAMSAVTANVAAQEQTAPEVADRYLNDAIKIKANSSVQDALAHIVAIEPQSRRDLIELTEIPAPPFEEQVRAERFAEMLREAGLVDVMIDEVQAGGRIP